MAYRIVKHDIPGKGSVFYPQYKPKWSPMWQSLESYYQSEFSEMPGWYTDHVNTFEEAQAVIGMHKSGLTVETSVVFQE